MQLFYVPDPELPLCTLPPEESAHCVRVMRLDSGAEVWLADGRGTLYRGRIQTPHPAQCRVMIEETIPDWGRRPYSLTVAVAPTKNIDRFEWFVEKATEMGIDRIVPLQCDHSERLRLRADRLERVVTSAMKQSLKAFRPRLEEPMTVDALLAGAPAGRRLIAHCREGEKTYIADSLRPGGETLVMIGPEGDFSEREVSLATAAGCTAVSLGPERLRTETAALAAVACLSFINNMRAE